MRRVIRLRAERLRRDGLVTGSELQVEKCIQLADVSRQWAEVGRLRQTAYGRRSVDRVQRSESEDANLETYKLTDFNLVSRRARMGGGSNEADVATNVAHLREAKQHEHRIEDDDVRYVVIESVA